MKKKLTLHPTTILNLTAPALAKVIGGRGAAAGLYAGVVSVCVDTRVEPCQFNIPLEKC